MVAARSDAVDPVFAEVAKAVLGPDVDVRELWDISKGMPDTSAVSTPGTPGQANKKKSLGAGLAFGTIAEGDSVASAAKTAFPEAAAAATKIAEPVTNVLKPILSSVPKIPGLGGGKGKFALQATNFGLGLAAAHELLKKPKPAPQAGAAPVAKRLVPVGDVDVMFVGQIAKFDTDKRQVFGWCSLSKVDGAEVIDLQGDYVPIEEMEASAYRYVLESRKGGDMHRRVKKGLTTNFDEPEHTSDLVESFVVTPEKLSKMGLAADALPLGWWVGFKVNDDAQWNLVKSGERTGFSIHGSGHRRPYDEIAKGDLKDGFKDGRTDATTNRYLSLSRRRSAKASTHVLRAVQRNKAAFPDTPARSRRFIAASAAGSHSVRVTGPSDKKVASRRYATQQEQGAKLHRILGNMASPPDSNGVRQLKPGAADMLHRQQREHGGLVTKGERTDRVKANIRLRAQSARNPGPVKLMPVKSTAVKAVGYQKPTRRLAVQMHSRDEPYVYRASPKTAAKVTGAKSVGRAYTSTIRGQAKRNPKLTPADRVRTFASKPKETQS